jgi:hypothetical protein
LFTERTTVSEIERPEGAQVDDLDVDPGLAPPPR